MERTARIKLVYESDKRRRTIGTVQIAIGIATILLSIGFFSTIGVDSKSSMALGTFSLLSGIFMIATGRATFMI